MKRLLALLLCAIFVVALASCGSGNAEKPAEKDAAEATEAPEAAEAAEAPASSETSQEDAKSKDVIVLKAGSSTVEGDIKWVALAKFKEIVEEKTDGAVQVDLYGSAALGSDRDMIESVKLGSLEMVITGAANFSNYEPKLGAPSLPFAFSDFETAWKYLDSGILDDAAQSLLETSDIRVLGYCCGGFRCVTNNVRPIVVPEDLKGLSIRTPEMPTVMAALSACGASPSPLAFNELYIALSQGTFDGEENPIPTIHANKLYEVQKYLSITNHSYDCTLLAISEKAFQKLTPEQQQIVIDAGVEAAQYQRPISKQQTEELVSELEELGMEINYPDLTLFQEATKDVPSQFVEDYGQELIDATMGFK